MLVLAKIRYVSCFRVFTNSQNKMGITVKVLGITAKEMHEKALH